uniref:NADH-ubiquinone oxidoreductase chain 2 n=1 Tax=Toxorhynchites sp. CL-2019 TaxID=2597067 RepID=A0A5B9H6R9_9DIPT|nr:NADH dehydrogenase subunit 2 [Toxorhynchites sp. CL-2019]UPX88075.1 NADH dehydrogenase subunit 2 [Aedeomyia squamipennis]
MKKISNNIFMTTLIFGTFLTISSNSWLGVWMGLEINLLSFIPLMNESKKNMLMSESSLKYFLIQAYASSILLFSILLLLLFNFNFIFNNEFINLMIFSTLALKSGIAPFHFWFPEVMEGLNWINNLILMTWQKIAPLMLISYNTNYNFMFFFIFLSMFIGALGGLNQTSLRKLMAFSSINHLSWMLMAMMYNEFLWMTYFIIYFFLSFSIVSIFNNFKLYHFNQIYNLPLMNPIIKFMIFINLLSLGGLPPFLGFFPKWIIIENLIKMNQFFTLIIAVCITLITLFYYLRMSYSIFMLNFNKNSWMLMNNFSNKNMTFILTMNFFSIMGLMIISLIYLIL